MKKGFTLIELLGVIVILGIVMGLAVIAFSNVRGKINNTYYKSIEETILLAGNDYFTYNKNLITEEKVYLKELIEKKYIEREIVSQDGSSCNLDSSYVLGVEKAFGTKEYKVCLICNDGYISKDCE